MGTNNGYATREALAKFTRSYRVVELPSGDKVRIQSLNNREKEELQLALLGRDGKPNYGAAIVGQQARCIVAAVVDGEGKRLFTDGEESFVQENFDPDVVDVLSTEIIEHCGINESGIERLKKKYSGSPDSNSHTS